MGTLQASCIVEMFDIESILVQFTTAALEFLTVPYWFFPPNLSLLVWDLIYLLRAGVQLRSRNFISFCEVWKVLRLRSSYLEITVEMLTCLPRQHTIYMYLSRRTWPGYWALSLPAWIMSSSRSWQLRAGSEQCLSEHQADTLSSHLELKTARGSLTSTTTFRCSSRSSRCAASLTLSLTVFIRRSGKRGQAEER